HVAIGNLAAGLVSLPDDPGIARLHPALAHVDKRRIPAPGVDAGDAYAARGQIERRLAADAAAGGGVQGVAQGAGVHVVDDLACPEGRLSRRVEDRLAL